MIWFVLVGLQGALLVGLGVSPWVVEAWTAPSWVRAGGAVLALAGGAVCLTAFPQLGRALSPLPQPRADAELTTSGIYRLVRHPIYSGVLALAWGWTAVFPSWWTVGLAAALTALLNGKARYEENLLAERFPEYRDYAERTPRFVPRPR